MAETIHDVKCDCCGRIMYRASTSGVKYTPGLSNRPPIQVTIGVRMYRLCDRACVLTTVREMSDGDLRAGAGFPLPWGWPSGGEEKPVGEG